MSQEYLGLPILEIISNRDGTGILDIFKNTCRIDFSDVNKPKWITIPRRQSQLFELIAIGKTMGPHPDNRQLDNWEPIVVLNKDKVLEEYYERRTSVKLRRRPRNTMKQIEALTGDQFLELVEITFKNELDEWWTEEKETASWYNERIKFVNKPALYDWKPWRHQTALDSYREMNASLVDYDEQYGSLEAKKEQEAGKLLKLLDQYPDSYEQYWIDDSLQQIEAGKKSLEDCVRERSAEIRKQRGIDDREEDEEEPPPEYMEDLEFYIDYWENLIKEKKEFIKELVPERDNYDSFEWRGKQIKGKFLNEKYAEWQNYTDDDFRDELARVRDQLQKYSDIKNWFFFWDRIVDSAKKVFGDMVLDKVPSEWTKKDTDIGGFKLQWMMMMDKTRYDIIKVNAIEQRQIIWEQEKEKYNQIWASIRQGESDYVKFTNIMFTLFTRWLASNRAFNWKALKRNYKELNKTYIGSGKRNAEGEPPTPPTGKKPPQKRGRTRTRGGKSRSRSRSGSVQLQINTMRDPKTGRVQFPSSSPKTSPPPGLEGKKLPPEGGGSSSSRSMDVDTQEQTHINIKF